jgi:uncharacterized protein (DUF58 family)
MEVPSLWKNLTITILQPVRQQTGFRMQSSRVADRGFHISGLRQFELGDSFRSLSRKHYARTGEEVIIERHPEQNALVLFLLDVSGSMLVGSVRRKLDVGLDLDIIATTAAMELLLEELSALVPESRRTDHTEAVDQALLLSEKRNAPADLVCIVSDYLFPSSHDHFYRDVSLLQEKTDVIGLLIRDPMEKAPAGYRGRLQVRNAESGEIAWLAGIRSPDIMHEFDRHGFEACTVSTTQGWQQWYETLDDFFRLRRGDFH